MAPSSRPQPANPAPPDGCLPAASEWLLDGFNILHAGLFPDRDRSEWWTQPHRTRLLELVQLFPLGETIWLVFDGSRPADAADAQQGSRIHVVFTPSADDWIVKRVKTAAAGVDVAVVTADRKLADRSRHHGAHPVHPRDFLARCSTE